MSVAYGWPLLASAKVGIPILAVALLAAQANAQVCHYRIVGLDWERLHEIFPDEYELSDPNLESISNIQWDMAGVEYDMTGGFDWTNKHLGFSQSNDEYLVKSPCGPNSVKELVESYGAVFDDRLSYTFETLSEDQYVCGRAANCCLDAEKQPQRCETSGIVGLWDWSD